MHHMFFPVLMWASCLFAGTLVAAPPFDAIYAFGDSLTDTGNEPAEPILHYQGRWSNGPLWIEYLSQRFGFAYNAGNNFANSGAQCNDTYRQVTNFIPARDVRQSLFVVWAGGNDFLQNYDKYWFDDSGWDQQIAYSVGNLSNAVVNLSGKGGRFILVPNTADLTQIPTLNFLPDFVRDYLRDKVKQFNSQLATALNQLQPAYPALKLFRCDVYGSVNYILHNASAYGFTETEIDALSDVTLLDKSLDGPGANYIFWDPIHPTTKAHALIADWFHAAVAPLSARLAVATKTMPLELRASELHLTKTYTLQTTTNLNNWSDVQTFVCVTTNQTLTITNDVSKAFVRLKRAP